jgi:hypothetical protein
MKPERTVELGSEVKDLVTGFQGIAVSEIEWLNGCYRYTIRPPVGKDGKILDDATFDGPQLKTVKTGAVKANPTRDNPDIELGAEVKDSVTGFRGIAVARMRWISGNVTIGVQPKFKKKEKEVPGIETFNVLNAISLEKKRKIVPVQKRTGGPLDFKPRDRE